MKHGKQEFKPKYSHVMLTCGDMNQGTFCNIMEMDEAVFGSRPSFATMWQRWVPGARRGEQDLLIMISVRGERPQSKS
jgi:hypothetical protein